MATAVSVTRTINSEIDGLLGGTKWSGTITYSFPDSPTDYSASYYGNGEPTTSGFAQAPYAMQLAINYAISLIAGYTNASIQFACSNGADIAIAQSPAANPTSYVTAAQLAGTTFQSGSGSDDLWVHAYDGILWGAWKEFHVNAPCADSISEDSSRRPETTR